MINKLSILNNKLFFTQINSAHSPFFKTSYSARENKLKYYINILLNVMFIFKLIKKHFLLFF